MNETSPRPQESDKEHAALTRVSYDLGQTIDGWMRKQEFDDPKSGFRAAIFQRENSDEYVLAFAGTERPLMSLMRSRRYSTPLTMP